MSSETESAHKSIIESTTESSIVVDPADVVVLADDRESNQWKWQHPGLGWAVLWTWCYE